METEVIGLYRETAPDLLRYAERIAGTPELAQDAVQEAFLRYYAARVEGRLGAAGRPWLFRVVRNYIFDRFKKLDRGAEAQSEGAETSDAGISPESLYRLTELSRLIHRRLSKREFECLSLRLHGLSYREIAREMGVETGSVATFLARALKKLRRELAIETGAGEPRGGEP
ncbi:MAG TPA: sigma-70 family RNA polymerase sigma factor [Terriglobales bacterium]|nr:sigma-70 family RNA polymerase sigma factor [Terriglobales bacterium]